MISVFELFKIGVGPSSSHTVGPMKAAAAFADGLRKSGAIAHVAAVEATLFGSLAFTGKGHATDKAAVHGNVAVAGIWIPIAREKPLAPISSNRLQVDTRSTEEASERLPG